MSETFHFKSFSIVKDGVRIRVNVDRFARQFQNAQYWLDSQIMTDMVPYMPFRAGTFVQLTRARSAAMAGSGRVVAAAPPYGRFLYGGLVMVDPETGSPWARPGVKKVLTNRPLTFGNQHAVPHWFDAAKAAHGKTWICEVKKRAGGG